MLLVTVFIQIDTDIVFISTVFVIFCDKVLNQQLFTAELRTVFLCWSVVSVTFIDFICTHAHFVHVADEILFEAFQVHFSYPIP